MNIADADKFKQLKTWRESQGMDRYNPPWATKVNNVELRLKNRQVNFIDENKKTQYS